MISVVVTVRRSPQRGKVLFVLFIDPEEIVENAVAVAGKSGA